MYAAVTVRWLPPAAQVSVYEPVPRSVVAAAKLQLTRPPELALFGPRPLVAIGAPDGSRPVAEQLAFAAVCAVSVPKRATVTLSGKLGFGTGPGLWVAGGTVRAAPGA